MENDYSGLIFQYKLVVKYKGTPFFFDNPVMWISEVFSLIETATEAFCKR